MVELSYPGVYVVEVPPSTRTITSASTSTAAFVGITERGPVGKPVLVTSFTEFVNRFGGFTDKNLLGIKDFKDPNVYLPYAVWAFFQNGGRRCYILRIAPGSRRAEATLRAGDGGEAIQLEAMDEGNWGNNIIIDVGMGEPLSVRGPDGRLTKKPAYRIEVREVNDGVTPDALGSILENIRIDDPSLSEEQKEERRRQKYRELINKSTTVLEIFESVTTDPDTPNSIDKAIRDGSKFIKVKNIKYGTTLQLSDAVSKGAEGGGGSSTMGSASGGSGGGSSSRRRRGSSDETSTSDGTSTGGSSGGGSSTSDIPPGSPSPPANTTTTGDSSKKMPFYKLDGGQAGTDPTSGDIVRMLTVKQSPLDEVRDVSIIATPGYTDYEVVNQGFTYCENHRNGLGDAFFIADVPESVDTSEEAKEHVGKEEFQPNFNGYGSIYFPWIEMRDQLTRGPNDVIKVPASGFVAGIYARIDNSRGVWKAPAGTEAGVSGGLRLSINLTDEQQGIINKVNVNALRTFPGYGTVVWGARTVSSDSAWRYVSVRRTANFLKSSIYDGIQWAVFEPNDKPLWDSLRMTIDGFMRDLFRQKAFQGSTPEQAYFVKCDAETTSPTDQQNGIVNILVGFAPLKPAEFVIVKLSQKVAQQQP